MPRQLTLCVDLSRPVGEQRRSLRQRLDLELLRPDDTGFLFNWKVGQNIALGVGATRATELPETRMEQSVELGNALPNCRLMQRDFQLPQLFEQTLLGHVRH